MAEKNKLMDMAFIKQLFDKKKRLNVLFALGMAGIVLIMLSQFLPKQKGEQDLSQSITPDQYIAQTEKQLLEFIKSIEGVGKAKIMVTLEQGVEYIYAQEEKSTLDFSENTSSDVITDQKKRSSTEQKYILVDGPNGKRTALLQTEMLPKIKGVVVTCEGAASKVVEQRVTIAITTALNLSSAKVFVTTLQPDQ